MKVDSKYPLPSMGVDVLSDETSLPPGAVRKAINVDIARDGGYRRRSGQTRLVSGYGFHSLWAQPYSDTMFVAREDTLYTIDAQMTLKPVAAVNGTSQLSFTQYNGNVYWVNNHTSGWLPSDSVTARGIGVETPSPVPRISAGLGGLTAGTYGVCITHIDDRGEESGATRVHTFELPEGGGLVLSDLPISPELRIRVYITDPDGGEPRSAVEFPAVFPSYQVTSQATGGICQTRHLSPLPNGQFVSWMGGRLYVANGDTLYFSNAMRPHLHNAAHNFIKFVGQITMLEALTTGIFVGDDRGVWFLSGPDPTDVRAALVHRSRVVARSSTVLRAECLPEKMVQSDAPVAIWLGESGYVVGKEGGETVALHPERIAVPTGLVGRTAYVVRGGIKQVITPVNSTSTVAFGTAVDSVIP